MVSFFLDYIKSYNLRDRFFVNTDSSPECLPYEHSKVAKFRRKYGNNILKNYRVLQPNDSKYEETPTFEEFVHYLVNTPPHLFDRHWEPIVYKCHICLFEYDLIAKYECFKPKRSLDLVMSIM